MTSGISQRKLLSLVFEAAQCFIPTNELSDEQKERLDNIQVRLCSCRRCRRALETKMPEGWAWVGHAQKETYKVGISRDALKLLAGIGTQEIFPTGFLEFIDISLHEIVHILFPEYSEEETTKKTFQWLNSLDWKALMFS